MGDDEIRRIESLKARIRTTDRAIDAIIDMLISRSIKASRTTTVASKALFDRRERLQAELDLIITRPPSPSS